MSSAGSACCELPVVLRRIGKTFSLSDFYRDNFYSKYALMKINFKIMIKTIEKYFRECIMSIENNFYKKDDIL